MTTSKPPKLTDTDKAAISDMVGLAFLEGCTPRQILARVQEKHPGYTSPMLLSKLKQIRMGHKQGWKATVDDTEANNQIAFLRYEALYALALEARDTKVAMEILKLMGQLLDKAQPELSRDTKRPVSSNARRKREPEVSVLNPEDSLEDLSDEALDAVLNQGQQAGSIPVKLADQLIAKDHS